MIERWKEALMCENKVIHQGRDGLCPKLPTSPDVSLASSTSVLQSCNCFKSISVADTAKGVMPPALQTGPTPAKLALPFSSMSIMVSSELS